MAGAAFIAAVSCFSCNAFTPSQVAVDSTASVPIYDRALLKPSIYYYYWGIHGAASGLRVSGMSGKITVTQ